MTVELSCFLAFFVKFHEFLFNSDGSLKACSGIVFFSEILFTFSSPFQSALLVLSSCVILVFLTSKIFANQKGACLSTQQTTSEFPLKIKGV